MSLHAQPEKDSGDKRRFDRRHSIYYLRVYNQNDGTLLGNLVDISEKGVMLVSDEPLELDRFYKLKMQLPEPMNGKETIEFTGRCAWCKSDINPHFFGAGFELINPKPEFSEMLESLIEAYMFKTY